MAKSVSILERNSNRYGLSYEEWTQKWWQWILSIPASKNPLNDSTGENASQKQYGPVFFLAGASEANPKVVRNIKLMKKTILFPIYNELRFDNRSFESDVPKMSVGINDSINRIELTENDLRRYKVRTETFSVNVIPENVFQSEPGEKNASSYGYWLIIILKEGTYRIRVEADKGSFASDVTYNLNLVKTDLESNDYMTMDGHNIKEYVVGRMRNAVDTADIKDVEKVVEESLKSPEVKQSAQNISAIDTVSRNLDDMMSSATELRKKENRMRISVKDVTTAILEQGKRGSFWPICE